MTSSRQRTQRSATRRVRATPKTSAAPAPVASPVTDSCQEHAPPALNLSDEDQLAVIQAGERWLRISWALSSRTLERARSVIGRNAAKQTRLLKLFRLEENDTSRQIRQFVAEVAIPEEASEWYLPVPDSTGAWMVDLGIRFAADRYFSLLHSPAVRLLPRTPEQGSRNDSLGSGRLGLLAESGGPPELAVRVALTVSGTTSPRGELVIDDTVVPVHPESGSFQQVLPASNGRKVYPLIVNEQGRMQRALLAVDINLRVLSQEPASDE